MMKRALILAVCLLIASATGAAEIATGEHPTSDGADTAVILRFGGDVMLARGVSQTILNSGSRYIWGDVLPLLNDADLTLVNLESVIAKSGTRFEPKRYYYFRAHPAAINALTDAGIDYVSMANNHAMDYRAEALLETIQRLEARGIAHAGAGTNREAAAKPAILKVKGLTIAVLSFANHYVEYGAAADAAGTNVIELGLTEGHLEPVRKSIEVARGAGADLIVFSIHWGKNWRQEPSENFAEFARAVIDAGVDIFHGHSAHVFQGIEIYKGKVILYDTGDLMDDYSINRVLRNDQQMLFTVAVERRGIVGVELIPLIFKGMQVRRAQGEDFQAIARKMKRLSRRFSTRIREEDDRLIVGLD